MAKANIDPNLLSIRIILVGDLGVGKTSIMNKICDYSGNTVEMLQKTI